MIFKTLKAAIIVIGNQRVYTFTRIILTLKAPGFKFNFLATCFCLATETRTFKAMHSLNQNKRPANMRRWPNVGLLLAHRLRRWPNTKTTLGQLGISTIHQILLQSCLFERQIEKLKTAIDLISISQS